MIIERKFYTDRLLAKSWNGKVKIITGIRRCGKSYLLSTLYKRLLLAKGVKAANIIEIDLEKEEWSECRNPRKLYDYVMSRTRDKRKKYYIFIDEIQLSYKVKNTDIDESLVDASDKELLYTTFYDILNSFIGHTNLDVYVTGSNSKMLSTDIITNFRDRGSEIRVFPLSFAEYCSTTTLDKYDALQEYMTWGGMPLAVLETDEHEKARYLTDLHRNVYLKDITERYHLKDDIIIDALTDSVYSAVGSLTNPHKLAMATGTFLSRPTTDKTVKTHLDCLKDAYLIHSAQRYDVKGKKYFHSTLKYYAMDVGLRNARLNFRQQDSGHLMENLIFNELIRRGYNVDVGVVAVEQITDGKRSQHQHEIDFIVNSPNHRTYIQSAWSIDSDDKRRQETFSLRNCRDYFRRIVVLGGNQKAYTDEDGITYVGLIPFLLTDTLLS